jgi:hypothetical protein
LTPPHDTDATGKSQEATQELPVGQSLREAATPFESQEERTREAPAIKRPKQPDLPSPDPKKPAMHYSRTSSAPKATLSVGQFGRPLGHTSPKPMAHHDPLAALGGVAGASRAAAQEARDQDDKGLASATSKRRTDRQPQHRSDTLVDLLWYADEAAGCARAHADWPTVQPAWRADEWITDGAAELTPAVERDGAVVARALTRIRCATPEEIAGSLSGAVDDEGLFRRPVLVVGGTLTMRFDGTDVLAAMVAAARPFAGDKRLAEPLEQAERIIAPDSHALTSALDAVRTRLASSFRAVASALPPDYLEHAAEQVLLEQHRYAGQVVFGGRHHGADLTPAAGKPVPCYLPEQAASQLPLFRSFTVRLLAHAHLRQSPGEALSVALRILALARAERLAP